MAFHLSRLFPAALLVASIVPSAPAAAEPEADKTIRSVLEEAREKQKGVIVYVQGASVGMAVQEIRGDHVLGKSREHSRVVIRLDRIDGVAIY
jgi:hypothetical protein